MRYTDMIDRGARIWPERLALDGAGGRFTYAELVRQSRQLAHAMTAKGYGRGAPFAIYTPNNTIGAIVQVGAMRAGAIWCNINLRNAMETNASILQRGGCRIVFYHSSVSAAVHELRTHAPNIEKLVCLDGADNGNPSFADFIAGAPTDRFDDTWSRLEPALQGSTGGTTGEPKIAVLSSEFFTFCTLGFATSFKYSAPPVNLAVAPITHAAGLVALVHLALGGTVVMHNSTDIGELFDAIERHRVTTLFLPPTLIYRMIAEAGAHQNSLSSLRFLMSAAAPIAANKVREAVELFGPVMCQSFGQTETGMPLTFMSPQETSEAAKNPALAHRLGSIGRQALMTAGLEIMDDDGNLLGPNQTGEIVVRGPSIMLGYLGDPEGSKEIAKFGWHHTGDMGHYDDDGYFYITDRKRDLIISGGFNIFPIEIENVLLGHDAVQDCAVVGLPDAQWGESVKAIVQLKPGRSVDPETLIALVKEQLGSMKTPRSLDFWSELPRNAAGKILKRDIRAHYGGRA